MTRSPIELSWTAKKIIWKVRKSMYYFLNQCNVFLFSSKLRINLRFNFLISLFFSPRKKSLFISSFSLQIPPSNIFKIRNVFKQSNIAKRIIFPLVCSSFHFRFAGDFIDIDWLQISNRRNIVFSGTGIVFLWDLDNHDWIRRMTVMIQR